MYLDKELQFSNSQALTAAARSTNAIDLGVAANYFDGVALCVLLNIEAAADFTTGNETYEVQLRTKADTDFDSGTTTLATWTILYSALTLGAKFVLPCPLGVATARYLELYYNLGGTTPTLTLSAFLAPVDSVALYRTYRDAITIN